jgi:hypothetical protein
MHQDENQDKNAKCASAAKNAALLLYLNVASAKDADPKDLKVNKQKKIFK